MSFSVDRKRIQKYPENSPIPLVIVEGFLGGIGALLWGSFEAHMNLGSEPARKVLFANVGPVSSLHDRACELFYAIKGGTVDYGEEHCRSHKHLRQGRTNPQGLYPEWSRHRPLHFLGHSMGGPTIIKLQWLLSTGFFGEHAHPDMILSVTSVSAPFRGTQLVYTLGEREDAAPAVRPLSVGSAITKVVHLVSFLAPFLPGSIDLHTESRGLSYHHSSFGALLKQLWKSDWAESRDAAPFDVTFEAAEDREALSEGKLNSSTYYRSHVATMTRRTDINNMHTPPLSQIINAPLYICSRLVGSFDYSVLRPVPSFLSSIPQSPTVSKAKTYPSDIEKGLHPISNPAPIKLDEEYWKNDGVVPLFSQWHPLPCGSTRCKHHTSNLSTDASISELSDDKCTPEPGIWHVYEIEDATHLSLAPLWLGSVRQKHYWEQLGRWLRSIDGRHAK